MRIDHRWTRRAGNMFFRTPISLILLFGLLTACGGGDAPPSEGASSRTSGIFGGTTSPTPAEQSPPASAPDESRDDASRAPESPAAPPPDTVRIDISSVGHTVGSPDAPIRVIEFSDFGCGYCRKFHLEIYPTLHAEYVETGKVVWKYIPFVLGMFPNGVEAARAGECAIAQNSFPPFRDRLFADQRAWSEESDPSDVFVRMAAEEELDAQRLRSCIQENRQEERVRRNIRIGRQVGIRGTPTFMIGGYRLQGAQPVEVFRQIFDQMLAERGTGTAPTRERER